MSNGVLTSDRRRATDGFTVLEVMVVVAMVGVVSAIALPSINGTMNHFRLSGDARGISNAVAVAKMRAASDFSRARLYIDVSARSHRVEVWRKTGTPAWVTEGGATALSRLAVFGFGSVSSPPPNSQATIEQPSACLDADGNAIALTACVVFNSRGIPIDATGAPTGTNVIYVTDGTAVYGTTVAATGLVRLWTTPPVSTPAWSLQ
jgi:prepilin-type N-terminal cleavage/methylation domain-containing protein